MSRKLADNYYEDAALEHIAVGYEEEYNLSIEATEYKRRMELKYSHTKKDAAIFGLRNDISYLNRMIQTARQMHEETAVYNECLGIAKRMFAEFSKR